MMSEAVWLDAILARFTELSLKQAPGRPPPCPDVWRERAAALESVATHLSLHRGAPGPASVRLQLAMDEAYAQAGPRGGELMLESVASIASLIGSGRLLHGTSSWAFSRILDDGEVRAGGDGLTGEIAITNILDPSIYVCESVNLLGLYTAVAFAHMNANRSGEELMVSAVRSGRWWLADFLDKLLFAEGSPTADGLVGRRSRVVRHRTLEMEDALRKAYEQALDLARRGELDVDVRQLSRRVGLAPEDAAFVNALCAVANRAEREAVRSGAMILPIPEAVLRWAPRLRGELLCPLPEDDEAERTRKQNTLSALESQFPCVLVIDPEGIDVRRPPYHWTGECLIQGTFPARNIVAVHAPEKELSRVRSELSAAGLHHVEVGALEAFEILRMVAEPTV